MSYEKLVDIPVRQSQLKACSFSSWYGRFKNHTPKSRIIKPLPREFIKYLSQDGIRLSFEENGSSYYDNTIEPTDDNDYSDWEEDEKTSVGDSKVALMPLVNFPDLHREIQSVISEFGAVTPKLNWSAPRDATWILPNNSSKCTDVNDVYLLLNASNYIAHDLDHAFDECVDKPENEFEDYELVLRQWFDINPALEFRIFIKEQEICGISQRDLNYYDYLEPLRGTFIEVIEKFIYDTVIPNFEDESFVVDVCIPRPFKKCWLIDFNPWSRITDPLLYSWNELMTKDLDSESEPELRLITEHNVGRFASKEHSENQVPKDIVDAS